jgi:hypothetical protein
MRIQEWNCRAPNSGAPAFRLTVACCVMFLGVLPCTLRGEELSAGDSISILPGYAWPSRATVRGV